MAYYYLYNLIGGLHALGYTQAFLSSTGEEVNWKRLLAVMVAELIVLIVLFDLYLYWRYEKGVFNWMHDNCCCHPGGIFGEINVVVTYY